MITQPQTDPTAAGIQAILKANNYQAPTKTGASPAPRWQDLVQNNSAPTQTPQPQQPNVLQETASNYGGQIKDSINKVVDAGKNAYNVGADPNSTIVDKAKAVGEMGLAAPAAAAQAIFAPISAPIQTLLSHVDAANKQHEAITGKPSPGTEGLNTPQAQAARDQITQWAKEHPELSKVLGDAFTVGTAALGNGPLNTSISDVAQGLKNSVVGASERLAGGVSAAKDSLLGTPEEQAAKTAADTTAQQAKQAETLRQQAIADATPAYNKKLIGEPAVNGVPRVQEGGGVIKGRTVTSTPSEIAAGEALAKVPGYAEAKTSLEKYNAINPEIAKQGDALVTSLKNEGVLRPPQEINKIVKDAVNNASQDSLLLQKSDPAVKNYLRVTQRAIAQSDGTLAGELKVRQALDNAYADAGGKYANNKGLDQIHRAARNALNDDLEAKASNTEVKASLKAQSDLYNAASILEDKAMAEGGSKLEQYMKAHPIGTKVMEGAAKAVGLGAGLHLLP